MKHEGAAAAVERLLVRYATSAKAKSSAWFFKTGPGQYGEGDRFIGVTVPEQRKVAKQFRELPLNEIETLLASPIHEHRLTALLILVGQYSRLKKTGDERSVVDFYLTHLDGVNNWDLVDSSASYILGDWIVAHHDDRRILAVLARSGDLWKERVAMIATAALINAGSFKPTLELAERFLTHRHDLIHKATGWMLREVGKQDRATLERFLDAHAREMPRTMLRYAIEKFEPHERKRYLELKKEAR
ncbi:DNA alkylation repair protein [Candidatus Berkelbacteria bacterium]|nr:DNA alkylation repair protein [Candidatus Berkelbacteria bacterium]